MEKGYVNLMSTSIVDTIEAEYDSFCQDRTKDLNKMYELLYDYLYTYISSRIKLGSYVDRDTAEELTQDVMMVIATKEIHTFEKRDAKFTTFCTAIAKNKAISYLRKRVRRAEDSFEEAQEEGITFSSRDLFSNPEKVLLLQEHKLEQIELLKKYLQLLMGQKGKPYRTAGCCYTMVLFHRYNPDSKELSSPKWAFEEVRENTVEESADRFEKEINEWFPRFGLYWGNDFLDGMEEKEVDCYIADMVYQEHFKVKDFENWSLRMRKKIKDAVMQQELGLLE